MAVGKLPLLPAPLKLNELGESRGTGSSSLSPPAASFSSRAWHYIPVYALCSAADLSILIELPAKVKRWEQGEKAWEGKGRGPGSSQAVDPPGGKNVSDMGGWFWIVPGLLPFSRKNPIVLNRNRPGEGQGLLKTKRQMGCKVAYK